jgi:actin beta/gamma 1
MEQFATPANAVKGYTHPKAGILTIKYPVQFGRVQNWDDWEKVLHDTFYNQLRIAPEENGVILLVRAGAKKAEIEKTVQILFETFSIPALLLMTTAEVALYKAGLFNNFGVIIESGDDLTQIVVIRNCRIVACKDILYGGANVNGWIHNKVVALGKSVKRDVIRHIKESQCYVALNPIELLGREDSQLPTYTNTYDEPFTLTKELFLAPETIFNPSLVSGEERKPLIDEIYDTVLASDADPKIALATLRNMVLVGGNTWFPGFKERLEHDMRVKLEGEGFCKVTAFPKQAVSYWRTTPLATIIKNKYDQRWITRTLYDGAGPSIATNGDLGLFIDKS